MDVTNEHADNDNFDYALTIARSPSGKVTYVATLFGVELYRGDQIELVIKILEDAICRQLPPCHSAFVVDPLKSSMYVVIEIPKQGKYEGRIVRRANDISVNYSGNSLRQLIDAVWERFNKLNPSWVHLRASASDMQDTQTAHAVQQQQANTTNATTSITVIFARAKSMGKGVGIKSLRVQSVSTRDEMLSVANLDPRCNRVYAVVDGVARLLGTRDVRRTSKDVEWSLKKSCMRYLP